MAYLGRTVELVGTLPYPRELRTGNPASGRVIGEGYRTVSVLLANDNPEAKTHVSIVDKSSVRVLWKESDES